MPPSPGPCRVAPSNQLRATSEHRLPNGVGKNIYICSCHNNDEAGTTNNATEIELNCSGKGLRTIIKFAYSGVLQINEANLMPTFDAAVAAEMQEVSETLLSLLYCVAHNSRLFPLCIG